MATLFPSFSHKALVTGLVRRDWGEAWEVALVVAPNLQGKKVTGDSQGLVAAVVKAHSQADEQCGQKEGGCELQSQQGC